MPTHRKHQIEWTETAETMLGEISDPRIRDLILDRVEKLADEPEKQGKALVGPLKGYRSIRASGQRYRIVYRVERSRLLVLVIGTGIRRDGSSSDVYQRVQKLLG